MQMMSPIVVQYSTYTTEHGKPAHLPIQNFMNLWFFFLSKVDFHQV